jgi:hypothetical protein
LALSFFFLLWVAILCRFLFLPQGTVPTPFDNYIAPGPVAPCDIFPTRACLMATHYAGFPFAGQVLNATKDSTFSRTAAGQPASIQQTSGTARKKVSCLLA